jgi:hypothetical protein
MASAVISAINRAGTGGCGHFVFTGSLNGGASRDFVIHQSEFEEITNPEDEPQTNVTLNTRTRLTLRVYSEMLESGLPLTLANARTVLIGKTFRV